ncbi:MAG TPA: DUF748 domain-containing protein, partial [Bacteroidota bacterium]|nr:DUF748 domain-containing protein [Bacteroidota bacterium]
MKTKKYSLGRIALIVAAVLILLYAVAGFFILPSILRTKLEESITSATGLKASIGSVRLNPFALSVTIDDFALADKDTSGSLFAFKRLYINVEARSLFIGATAFSEIAIDSPFVHVKVHRDGTTNLPSMAQSDASTPAADTAAAVRKFFVVIDRFELTRGRTIYEDRSHAPARIARVDSLNLKLNDFTTRPDEKGEYAFDASTDRGEKISWQGTIQAAPFKSSGAISLQGIKARTLWEFMQDRLNYELTDGELSGTARYAIDMSAPKMQFNLTQVGMNAKSLRLIDNETKTEQMVCPILSLDNMNLDYGSKSIRIGSLRGKNAVLRTKREIDGSFSLSALLMMKPDPTAPKEAPWKITLDRIQFEDNSVLVADQNTAPATDLVLEPVSLTIEHYNVLSSTPASLSVRGGMKPTGSFSVDGTFTDEPVTATVMLSCSAIHLPTFQKFVDKFGTLIIESGELGVKGKVTYAAIGRDTTMNFAGNASVSSLRAIDPLVNRDFLRWRSLEIQHITFARTPASLAIDEIVANEAYIRFIIDSTRTSNVQRIMAIHPIDAAQPDSGAKADTLARAEAGIPTKIKLIRVVNGSMNFADYSLSPNFVTGIQSLNGSIVGMNSQELTHAEMTLDGKVDRYAPVEIRGQINPLSADTYTDISMKFHNIELTTFTPYFGKFAGYKIDKGKLSLDLHYKLNKDMLEAENSIVVDQLTLGEKVEGPDVTSIPVRLAVALLKDSKGVIDLDLPIKGSLNDPEFSVFPIVVKVLVNLLSKAVLSPFKLLGSLIGSGEEDLSAVQFRPGTDSLEAAEQTKLTSLVKALNERPGLKLEVRGLVCDSLDRLAVAEARLLKQVRAMGGTDPELTESDNGRILQLYRQRFKTDPDSLVPAGGDDEAARKERQ